MFTENKAFTLIEIIITLTLFSVVALAITTVMANTLRTTKKLRAQVFLYTETEALLNQLASAIQNNTIDYEAYYARNVGKQGTKEIGWATPDYGAYQQTFMDPGTQGIPSSTDGVYKNVDGYGSACTSAGGTYPDDCPTAIPYTDSLDLDTGAHPFPDIDSIYSAYSDDDTYSNAVCENSSSCGDITNYPLNELILINGGGDERTIFEKELYSGSDYGIAKVAMAGTDTDNDGAVDLWKCDSDYTCTYSDGGPDSTEFKFITPSLLNVTDIYFYIVPIEDPYRAFAESSEKVQIQPQVTIVLTATLSSDYGSFLGDTPTVTVQRTVSTGVYSKINSYAE